MDKEDFVAMSTFQLWVYLLWIGVAIHCDHGKLAYIVDGAPTSNAQRLQGWTVFLGQFPYTVVHIPGDDNCWGDLQSRWVTRPGGPVCAHGSVQYTEMRSMRATSFRGRMLCAACRRPLQRADPHSTRDWGGFAGFRRAVPGSAPWPPHDLGAGRGRLSEEATPGVYPRGEGRKPVDATMARLERHCAWKNIAGDLRDMTRLCLSCADTKVGASVPCTLE